MSQRPFVRGDIVRVVPDFNTSAWTVTLGSETNSFLSGMAKQFDLPVGTFIAKLDMYNPENWMLLSRSRVPGNKIELWLGVSVRSGKLSLFFDNEIDRRIIPGTPVDEL